MKPAHTKTRIRHYHANNCEEDAALKLRQSASNTALQPHNLGDFLLTISTVLNL